MKQLCVIACSAVAFVVAHADLASAQTSCADLTGVSLPNTTIQSAETVSPGLFVPPPGPPGAPPQPPVAIVDSFCRVKGAISPVPGSNIQLEVWLPASWNGKFMAIGNSGANGEISYTLTDASLARALNRGYATAGTDTGHVSSPVDATWAVGNPEAIIDNGERSIVEVTAAAKAIVDVFYGDGPAFSYFFGCSMGGRQGLMQAQRYPDAYDGVIAGAPVLNLPNLTAVGVSQAQLLADAGGIPQSKLPAIAAAVLAECDGADGLVDGLVDDPRVCEWEPDQLICEGPETNACLTEGQALALTRIYQGPRRSDTNEKIHPGLERGGEDGFGPLGWATAVTGPPAPGAPPGTPGIGALLASGYISNVAFQNPNPFFKTFTYDFADDLDFVTDQLADLYNADDPDLSDFRALGGKVLMYHGWSDPIVPPRSSTDYYKVVRQAFDPNDLPDFLRLFMAPGMEHCVGGTGPFIFDAVSALEGWVEEGVAPERIDALHVNLATGMPTRTRPLCRYPNVARYIGSGSIDSAANFVCVEPD